MFRLCQLPSLPTAQIVGSLQRLTKGFSMRGEYLVLLNNDVVVTDGWLDQLIALASMRRGTTETEREAESGGRNGAEGGILTATDAKSAKGETDHDEVCGTHGVPNLKSKIQNPKSEVMIGLVGPMSNYAAPPQLVADVPYRDLDEMKVFARACARSTWARGSQCGSCRGFA